MSRPAVFRVSAVVVCAMACVMLAAGCGRRDARPVLKAAALAGTWKSPNGGEIIFSGGGQRFSATNLRLDEYKAGPGSNRECAHVSGSGTWQFIGPQGESGPYLSGNLLNLSFNSVTNPAMLPCTTIVQFTSWEINPPLKLCFGLDPDSPCDGYIFTKERLSAGGPEPMSGRT